MIMNEIKRLQQLAGINEIKINNPNQISINDLIIGKTYKFIYDEGDGEKSKIGKVLEIDKNPQEGDLRIELHTPGDEYEYYELYSDEIIKIFKNTSINEIRINNPFQNQERFNLYKEKVIEELENYMENSGDIQEEGNILEYIDKAEEAKNEEELDKILLWLYSGDQNTVLSSKEDMLDSLDEIFKI